MNDAFGRANDPRNVRYPESRPEIKRSEGTTPSERYLAKLGDRSFLNLWCYPNVFIDKKIRGKGDGKELCDLLVVCGDDVIVFSDKSVAWPQGSDEFVSWRRWYKRAISKSADQIRGAIRWIQQYPNRIYLDRACTVPLPIELPPPERMRVHGIVVALGAGDACEKHFGRGHRSLIVNPDISDDAQFLTVGDVNPDGPFIHVLDDANLDIVMRGLDTIIDLTLYLRRKESLVRSGKLVMAAGEEELVAYYMTHLNKNHEHDFVQGNGEEFGEGTSIALDVGFHDELKNNPQYLAKIEADRISYLWDALITQFATHMLKGTALVPEGQSDQVGVLERVLRFMAIVPRFKRRVLGQLILEATDIPAKADRRTKALIPGPTEVERETGYFFMCLPVPGWKLGGGYEQYRRVRTSMLETYAYALLQKYPFLKRIIGVASEPPQSKKNQGSSEDLLLLEQPAWTPDLLRELEERKKLYSIAQAGNFNETPVQGNEFPSVSRPSKKEKQSTTFQGLNRHERRKREALRRRGQLL